MISPIRCGLLFLAFAVFAVTCSVAAEQPLNQRYRFSVRVDPGDTPRTNAPVGIEVDFAELFRKNRIDGRLDQDSIRVVRIEPNSRNAIPYSAERNACPHQTTGDFFNRQHGMIWWRMRDKTATDFFVYFDTIEKGLRKPPQPLGLIGIGDYFHYNDGAPGFANAVALHSQLWHLDWDGDGLRDFIGFGYRPYEYGPDRPRFPSDADPTWWRKVQPAMGNAVYFHRNIGTNRQPLFAPRQRVQAADGTYLRSDLLPQNMFPADWDADGDPDFFGIGARNELLVWENSGDRDPNGLWLLKTARVEGKLDQTSKFRDEFPAMVERPSRFSFRGIRRVDWEGDGDWDLLTAVRRVNRLWPVDAKKGIIPYGANIMFFELLENTAGPDAKPVYAKPFVIREERGLPINAFSVATGCAEYVDWDGDGDNDLLYHDLTNRPLAGGQLMLAENRGSRDKPLFSMPIPILAVHDSPVVLDWTSDGRADLVAGSELFENMNTAPKRLVAPRTSAGSRVPLDAQHPQLVSRGFAQQVNPPIVSYFGVSVDWDGDGVLDMIRGHQSHVLFFRNRGTLLDPIFERGVRLESGGRPIYMPNWLDANTNPPSHFGPQGPSEPAYGWLNPTVGDWDGDGDLDLFLTGQRWQTVFFENTGSRTKPSLALGRGVTVDGNRHEFSWRSKVSIGDIDSDGRMELVVTSNEDRVFYAYEQDASHADSDELNLVRGEPLKLENGDSVTGWYGGQNNNGDNHSLLVDWDNDGDLDLINGSLFAVWYYENIGSKTEPCFRAHGRFTAGGEPLHTFFHAGSIDAADWNGDGRMDLVLSTEMPSDSPHGGVLHFFDRSFLENDLPTATAGPFEIISAK